MNVQQIEYVIAVSKYLNFGKAAESCFITQSTLSTMIGRLEKELNIQIFDRKSKPISVTKEGQKIIAQLKNISKEIAYLDEVVQELKGELSGKLTIGAIPTVAPYLFPYFLSDFITQFQNIQFEVSEITTEKIIDGILSRELDIGIVSIPLKQDEIVEIPLYTEQFLIYDKAPCEAKKRMELGEIDLERLWLLEEGHCLRNQVEKICKLQQQRLINGNLVYKSGTLDTLMKFVDLNNGVTLLPELATQKMNSIDKMCLQHFLPPVPSRQIGLVFHKHFVKKKMLVNLQKAIQEKLIPVLTAEENSKVISPLKKP